MRRRAELLLVAALLGTAVLWRLPDRFRTPVVPPSCTAVAGIGERVACPDDSALAGCDAVAGRRYERGADGTCREAGPLRGAVLRMHGQALEANRATDEDLRAVDGIGASMAARIVQERSRGPYCSANDLRRVRGVGPARAAALAPALVFDDPACGKR